MSYRFGYRHIFLIPIILAHIARKEEIIPRRANHHRRGSRVYITNPILVEIETPSVINTCNHHILTNYLTGQFPLNLGIGLDEVFAWFHKHYRLSIAHHPTFASVKTIEHHRIFFIFVHERDFITKGKMVIAVSIIILKILIIALIEPRDPNFRCGCLNRFILSLHSRGARGQHQ